MRQLKTFQSLWSMQPHDQTGEILPYDRVCGMVRDAGYDGLAIDLGAADVATAYEVRPHMDREGLTPLIVAFPKSVESLRETLKMAKDFGSPYVIQFETHRNCITNDLFFTLCLLDAVPEMRLAGDFSHYMVDREFKLPLSHWERGLIQRCIERCDSFQGRVASRQQVQLQLDFPQNAKWVELFEEFWTAGLTNWCDRNEDGDLVFLCELGPPEYAMTGPDGREMSNRWDEALVIKDKVNAIWSKLNTP